MKTYKLPDKDSSALLLLYVASTSFFIIQHTTGISWDYCVYVLNSRYWFGDGFFLEWLRPPLTSIIMGLYSVFGWLAAEYLYIISTSMLYMYSSTKLAGVLKLDKVLFYGLMLSPFTLNYGFFAGTELLYMSILQLFIAYLDKKKSGVYIALAILTHYTTLIYVPLLLFKKQRRKILTALAIALFLISPWLIYNYVLTGNPLTSMIDSYAMNVKFRNEYMHEPFNFSHVLTVLGYYILLLPAGVYVRLKNPGRTDLLIISFMLLSLASYYTIPLKNPRFLFALILPAAYFTAAWMQGREHGREMIYSIILLNFVFASLLFTPLDETTPYTGIQHKLDDCMLQSNAWPYLNYYGVPTEPYPSKQDIAKEINTGKRILLYKTDIEPEYAKDLDFLRGFPTMEETDEYILLGNESICARQYKINKPYLHKLRERGVGVTTCEILLPENICGSLMQL